MNIKAEIMSIMAFRIYTDMSYGIKPRSYQSAVNWLKLANAWAIANKEKKLECQISGYLASINALPIPVESAVCELALAPV